MCVLFLGNRQIRRGSGGRGTQGACSPYHLGAEMCVCIQESQNKPSLAQSKWKYHQMVLNFTKFPGGGPPDPPLALSHLTCSCAAHTSAALHPHFKNPGSAPADEVRWNVRLCVLCMFFSELGMFITEQFPETYGVYLCVIGLQLLEVCA